MEKYNKLVEHLKQYSKLCVSYSGGADSSLLIKAAKDALGDNAIAVIADTDLFARQDIEDAVKIAADVGVVCFVTNIEVLEIPQLANNEINRCYHCKSTVFMGISKTAYANGIKIIADGRIADDSTKYRPGGAAAEELGIISPLADCGLYKTDVREISKKLGLPTWDKPSNSCLTTRFPYETEITKEKLDMVEQAEMVLKDIGAKYVRVRTYDDLARIEVSKDNFNLLIEHTEIIEKFKALGYKHVTLDLEGFISGSMD